MPSGSPVFSAVSTPATAQNSGYFEDDHMGELSPSDSSRPLTHIPVSDSDTTLSSRLTASHQTSPPPPPPPPLPTFGPTTYAGALARFGKAIYGGSTPATPATLSSSNIPLRQQQQQQVQQSQRQPPVMPSRQDEIKYTARSEIIAMGPAHTDNVVAIAGKDCKFTAIFVFIYFSSTGLMR